MCIGLSRVLCVLLEISNFCNFWNYDKNLSNKTQFPMSFIASLDYHTKRPLQKVYRRGWVIGPARKIHRGILPIPSLILQEVKKLEI